MKPLRDPVLQAVNNEVCYADRVGRCEARREGRQRLAVPGTQPDRFKPE